MQRDCNYIPPEELSAMTDKELIQHLRKCEKLLGPLKEELDKRRDLANSSCPI